jgi:hypothetical protein
VGKFLLVILVFAAVTYLITRALQERSPGARPSLPRPKAPRRRPSTPPRSVAPDDDEDFLRDLDRRRLNPPDDV